jgi:hypothetical protein
MQRVATLEMAAAKTSAAVQAPFRIDCPAGWRVLPPVQGLLWMCQRPVSAPGEVSENCNVAASDDLGQKGPQAYMSFALASAPQLRAARIVSEGKAQLSGKPAYEVVYDHELVGTPLRVLSTVVLRKGQAYVVTCTSSVSAFPGYEQTFRRTLGTLAFADSGAHR